MQNIRSDVLFRYFMKILSVSFIIFKTDILNNQDFRDELLNGERFYKYQNYGAQFGRGRG